MNASHCDDTMRFARSAIDPATERDALRSRVRMLETALARIGREAEVPLLHPETSFITVHRIASVARLYAAPSPAAGLPA